MYGDISVTSRAERRRYRRSQTSLIATVNYDRLLLPCLVADLSLGGAKIKLLELSKLPAGPA
ncbi:MAG: PilZ domain-containing protein, partial [Rhodospirillaceae bacterium]|nr:PilZ domain-containing protein [Rhodospirillaceae bacterium]